MSIHSSRLPDKHRLVTILALVTAIVCSSLFSENVIADNGQKPLLRESSVNRLSATRRTFRQLSLYTDLWHMAAIRGNDKEAVRYQQTLVTIVRADIGATARLTRGLAHRIVLFGLDSGMRGESRKSLASQFTRSLKLHNSKVNLMIQFDRRHLSDNTSFLAGKYMDILRRQMGLEKIWLATSTVPSQPRTTNH